jgi:hypothetical protein
MVRKKRTPTEMGMTFNGATQLVQMGSDNKLPAVDGSNLTNITNSHAHSNSSALALVSGTNTGDQDISGKQDTSAKGQANGYAGLDSNGYLSAYDGRNLTNIRDCYSLFLQADTATSMADSTSFYFGQHARMGVVTTSSTYKVYIPKAGVIRAANIYCGLGTKSSNENFTVAIRLNDTTDYTVTTTADLSPAFHININNTSLNIPVVAGDYICIKITTPAWGTDPANLRWCANLFIGA